MKRQNRENLNKKAAEYQNVQGKQADKVIRKLLNDAQRDSEKRKKK